MSMTPVRLPRLPPMPSMDESAREQEPIGLPVRHMLAIIRRRMWLVLLVLALGTGGTFAYLLRAAPIYRAEASVLIEPRRSQVSDLQAISPDTSSASPIRTQVDILRSPALARRVVERLGLAGTPEFSGGTGIATRVFQTAKDWLGISSPHDVPSVSDDPTEVAAAIIASRIGVQNESRSNVMSIWIETGSPELSAQIVNAYAQELLEFRRRQKSAAMERAHSWFAARLDELAERMRASDRAIEAYRIEHGLTEMIGSSTTGAPVTTVNRQQLDEVTRLLSAAEAERSRKESQLAEAEAAFGRSGRLDALPEVLTSVIIRNLRDQDAAAAAREAQLSTTLGPRAPDLMAVRAERAGLRRRMREEMSNALAALRTEAASARAQETALRTRLTALRATVGQDNVAEVRLQSLRAEAQANRAIYESFLTRATQLANADGIQEPDAELVSEAVPSNVPSGPRRGRILLIAFGASLVLGIVLAFLRERLREGFSSAEALEAALGIASVGVLPKADPDAQRGHGNRIAALEFGAAVSRLRGVLQVSAAGAQVKTVLVTSALPREGKSALAVGMARQAARSGSRVLVIDADLRKPMTSRDFELGHLSGLAEILQGNAIGNGREVIRQVESGLHVLPGGRVIGDPIDLLASARLGELLDWAGRNFDLVVVDAPPVLPTADSILIGRLTDATLFAVRWEDTPRAAARDALRLLEAGGARVLGVVLTQVDIRHFARQARDGLAFLYRDHRGYYGEVRGRAQ